jgi:chromate transporter
MMELLRLALSCLRVGAFVFGGGPVLVPLLEEDIVNRYAWLSSDEFTDAVALGQMTPGPLLVTATFVGYRLGSEQGGGAWAGLLYAAIATVCIFLPSFFMVIAASHQLAKLKAHAGVQRFLAGVKAGVVGLVAWAAIDIGRGSIDFWVQWVICAGALVALIRFKLDMGLVVLSCGTLGFLAWACGLIHLGQG